VQRNVRAKSVGIVELDFNVMAYAQKTAFLCRRNGQALVVLQCIRGTDGSFRCCQVVSAWSGS
jgi:hypothetical protein